METVFQLIYLLLAVAFALGFFRLMKGPSIPDRIMALDFEGGVLLCAAVVYGIQTGRAAFLDVALAVAVILFVGTVAFARYIERSALAEAQSDRAMETVLEEVDS